MRLIEISVALAVIGAIVLVMGTRYGNMFDRASAVAESDCAVGIFRSFAAHHDLDVLSIGGTTSLVAAVATLPANSTAAGCAGSFEAHWAYWTYDGNTRKVAYDWGGDPAGQRDLSGMYERGGVLQDETVVFALFSDYGHVTSEDMRDVRMSFSKLGRLNRSMAPDN